MKRKEIFHNMPCITASDKCIAVEQNNINEKLIGHQKEEKIMKFMK